MSTKIEWTRGDDGTPGETWNPTLGCSKVSPGCDNCYAIRVAARGMSPEHRGLTKDGDWTGEVRCLPERLDTPLRWRKPRRVFVDSMSDLFHRDVPYEFVSQVFSVIERTPQHTYQVLTKRARRMREYVARWCNERVGPNGGALVEGVLPNLWLGVSVEGQRNADRRIPHLLATPAAVRFLSCEPLLGPIDLTDWLCAWNRARRHSIDNPGHILDLDYCDSCDVDPQRGIDWCIVGGESGPGARPMHPDWARSLRDQCVAAGVAFHFKQWGEWAPGSVLMSDEEALAAGAVCVELEDGAIVPWNQEPLDSPAATMRRVGKKAAGRELDGRTWDEYPR